VFSKVRWEGKKEEKKKKGLKLLGEKIPNRGVGEALQGESDAQGKYTKSLKS